MAEVVTKMALYYFHERAWYKINFGLPKRTQTEKWKKTSRMLLSKDKLSTPRTTFCTLTTDMAYAIVQWGQKIHNYCDRACLLLAYQQTWMCAVDVLSIIICIILLFCIFFIVAIYTSK